MKLLKKIALILAVMACSANMTNAQSLSDILSKLGGSGSSTSSSSQSSTSSTIGNLLEGIFSSSNITVADLTGNWTTKGPAVCFQGDNFLKKAGGVAAASALETKLQPYYTKYGLTGASLVINNDATFTLTIKKLKMSGTITEGSEKGVFAFNFKVVNKINIGKVNTYVQKTSKTMDVMFDATKLISIVNAVAKVSGISAAQTLSSLLSSYDGLCVGFSCAAN